jgi:hypothetical protein
MPMTGRGPINLKVDQHTFREQPDLATARAEARRLSAATGAVIVTYLPVYIVEPPRPAIERTVPVPNDWLRELSDDLPF